MPDTFTPNLNLTKPEVGGSRDTWGQKWDDNADKIDAGVKALSDKIDNFPTGPAVSLCEMVALGNSVFRLRGKDGNSIMIDGKPRTIPPAGVDFNTTSGAGVVASANNYLVAFWDTTTDPANPRIGLKAVQTARTVHSTLGYATCGNNVETLVAGFYAESDKSVYYTRQRKNFATWYGKKPRAISGDVVGGINTGGGNFVELSPVARCYAYLWAGIAADIVASCDFNPSTYDNQHIAVSLSNNQTDAFMSYVQGTMPQSNVFPGTARLPCEPDVDGLQYVTCLGKVNNSTGAFNRIRTSALVHI